MKFIKDLYVANLNREAVLLCRVPKKAFTHPALEETARNQNTSAYNYKKIIRTGMTLSGAVKIYTYDAKLKTQTTITAPYP